MSETLVSICCLTYNHEQYIRECIEGFLIQKTDFLFEIIIHDDASTDNTSSIIREYEARYPEIIKPIYQSENQWSKGISPSLNFVWPRARGKYIALCEGDDYWIDKYKLSKQVDFIEKNPEFGMTYSMAYIFENGKLTSKKTGANIIGSNLFLRNTIPTLTVMFRKELLIDYLKFINPADKDWTIGDYPLWLWIKCNSKIHFQPEITSVYRILRNSLSNKGSRLDFSLKSYEISKFFLEKFDVNNKRKILKNRRLFLLLLSFKHEPKRTLNFLRFYFSR
ncbi:MAG TPA: hypothetical protein DEO54_07775 [Rikenellaceae bacterium]|nr:MAG: hypothetical protein A2X20_02300 [Bacteroidetes bacterium GWE2_40_15]HBZ26123.1 hypothetical protein [Rikenellaceae bacterium]